MTGQTIVTRPSTPAPLSRARDTRHVTQLDPPSQFASLLSVGTEHRRVTAQSSDGAASTLSQTDKQADKHTHTPTIIDCPAPP